MTQTEKRILISELCARLQYGVKVDCTDGIVQLESVDFELGSDRPVFWHNGIGTNLTIDEDNIKPYLFPLSSMTEEQMHEFFCRFIVNEIDYIDFKHYYVEQNRWDKIFTTIPDCFEVVAWFNKNHFDINGLIPLDLAIDATDKNIY